MLFLKKIALANLAKRFWHFDWDCFESVVQTDKWCLNNIES